MSASDDTVPVTVVMPVFNGQKYLDEAIRSIRTQDMNAFRLVIVDDASTDRSFEIASAHAASDPRIRVLRFDQNVGNFAARNRGIEEAVGRYLAVMDSDDISEPNRLSVQLHFMERTPHCIISGSGFKRIDSDGRTLITSFRPRDDYCCRWLNRFLLPLCHSTFFVRRMPEDGRFLQYSTEFRTSSDHDYFSRILKYGEAYCLPSILVSYRVHDSSISNQHREDQVRNSEIIVHRYIQENENAAVSDLLEPFFNLYFAKKDLTRSSISAMVGGFRKLVRMDVAAAPERQSWIYRQSAQMMVLALRRAGASKDATAAMALGWAGTEFLPSLALRLLETKGFLPKWLDSNPEIQT